MRSCQELAKNLNQETHSDLKKTLQKTLHDFVLTRIQVRFFKILLKSHKTILQKILLRNALLSHNDLIQDIVSYYLYKKNMGKIFLLYIMKTKFLIWYNIFSCINYHHILLDDSLDNWKVYYKIKKMFFIIYLSCWIFHYFFYNLIKIYLQKFQNKKKCFSISITYGKLIIYFLKILLRNKIS